MKHLWKKALLLLGVSLPCLSFAQIQELIIRIDGLYCPLCTQPTLKAVRKVNGVESGSMDLEEGVFTIQLKDNAPFQPQKIIDVLGTSSYVYRNMLVVVEGTIGSQGGQKTLNVPENNVTFTLQDSDEMTVAAKKAFDSASGKVLVKGYYTPSATNPILKVVSVTQS